MPTDIYRGWFRDALRLADSSNPFERECLLLGINEDNGSPFYCPIPQLDNHLHAEGPAGSGKTSSLCALLEQHAHRQDRTFVIIDMKGDSNELLAAVYSSGLPVRWFIDRVGASSFTLNIFEQRAFQRLTPVQKANALGAVLGTVTTMAGHGVQWFQGASAEVLQQAFEREDFTTFSELAEFVHRFVIHGRRDDLHSDIRAAGLQAYLDVRRMGSVQALNQVGNPLGLELSELFERPQVLYICLPSAGNYALAGALCRLFLGGIFDAAAVATRKVQVQVICDEFHRAIASGMIEVLLTQARSCGINFILANQTIQDLVTREKDLRPTIKNCCRCHWQFGEGSPDFQAELAETGGTFEDLDVAATYSWWQPSHKAVARWQATQKTARIVQAPRLPLNEIKRVTADPSLSFFTASGDTGLYQFSGYPQIVESEPHITREEYERRKLMPWPEPVEGCIVAEMPGRKVDPPEPPLDIGRVGRPKRS